MMSTVFDGRNALSMKNVEKLYTDSKTADVNFVFIIDDEQFISIPAHKSILAVGSPVFEAMFYGPMKEKDDVKIVDASPEAFKVFLQFFYLGKVQLTSNNIISVTKLCHKYEVADALTFCEKVLQKILTINDIRTYYELAILLDLESKITFCEQQIKQNPEVILKSDDFLKYDRKMLDKILELVSSNCRPSTIVDACIAWAKDVCERNNQQPTPARLRAELDELIGRIPFEKLTKDEFILFNVTYEGLLKEIDFKAIILKTMAINDKIATEKEQLILKNVKLFEEVKTLRRKDWHKKESNYKYGPQTTRVVHNDDGWTTRVVHNNDGWE
ncbi:BTB/POZ domain-containing protein 6-A-like [Contarinia nasturtii]|uniref:BTB/POZ domain-containing protein 6-A-like n=1 Tax=Contarinia nasturtii TaxID=265458 RepID=UPI0012D40766|nr:BTB/POZ domain-containing protein 6-A-like [Contarinia nasturtii]